MRCVPGPLHLGGYACITESGLCTQKLTCGCCRDPQGGGCCCCCWHAFSQGRALFEGNRQPPGAHRLRNTHLCRRHRQLGSGVGQRCKNVVDHGGRQCEGETLTCGGHSCFCPVVVVVVLGRETTETTWLIYRVREQLPYREIILHCP